MQYIAFNQFVLKRLSDSCPENFQQKYHLVEAERYRVLGDAANALHHYEMSINLSKEHDFLNDEALANELTADFFIAQHNTKIAGAYLTEAYHLYKRWGATAKLSWLEKTHHDLLSSHHSVFSFNSDNPSKNTSMTTTRSVTDALDLSTMMKTAHAISREIRLDSLLTHLIHSVVENVGSESGFIILKSDHDSDELLIQAEYQVGSQKTKVLQAEPLSESSLIAKSVVKYSALSKQPVVLNNASSEEAFFHDPYIQIKKPKSILCFPLINQTKLSGLIYLENNLMEGVFNEQRLRILELIASQIAVALDNARLYTQLSNQKEQIENLLNLTKEMSKSESKVAAGIIALKYIRRIDSHIDMIESYLYCRQSNDSNQYIGYELAKNQIVADAPLPFTLSEGQTAYLKNLTDIAIDDETLYLPIKSERSSHAVLSIKSYHHRSDQLDPDKVDIFEGISRSLALAMDNIEAERNNRLANIGTMAASIVHDLKNPISAIMGSAALAYRKDSTPEERRSHLDDINEEAKRMSIMAHEVLEFSRGSVQLDLQKLKIEDYYQLIVKRLMSVVAQQNIEFTHSLKSSGTATIDIHRMHRVIINLATNACDAMQQQAQEGRKLTLEISNNDDRLIIEVSDNGPGIPEAIRATLFEEFVTHGKAHGTGLGMAITKKIIDAHSGTIDFTSETGQGTQFIINLPRAFSSDVVNTEIDHSKLPESTMASDDHLSDNIESEHADSLTKDQLGTKKILLAEDNVVNQKVLAAYLKSWHCHVEIVDNGKAALRALESNSFDLLLMDLEMPIMGGLEAAQQIRVNTEILELNRDIPIVALTGHEATEVEQSCLSVGMNAILTKPINADKLQQIIRSFF